MFKDVKRGRQSITERKGPHKSMHCKFCKPPGVVTPEKSTRPQLETKTNLHLVHEAADLRVYNIHNEPGFPAVEYEACLCVLEGENPCPKCVPDKNKPPPKKKVCRCPKGAKPHPCMYTETTPRKKKQVEEDDEFWWEKYSREHDAQAKETWEAYMAQRKKDRKLEKCQRRETQAVIAKKAKGLPTWYQKLSCQQMIYVEYLSTAIRLDSDENVTDRTFFVMGGIGMFPRPNKKLLKKCLRYCHYNSIHFLNQLHILIKDDDPFQEKLLQKNGQAFTWNERLIMNSICHLEFPGLLRDLLDRIPPLPRKPMLPQISYPVFPQLPKKKYDSPYEEPIWQDRLNWVEKSKIDRLNRCRLHMETKRIKIPPLALVRRPSLIDARPPFLAQIEANERASRRLVKEEDMKSTRRHPISTFNSAVDMTAIAGIEASEISTTDKADTDDICVFLQEPKEPGCEEGEMEEEKDEESELFSVKEVKYLEEPPKMQTQVNCVLPCTEDFSEEVDERADDIPFKTPPKTESGATIASPCPPPDTTPGPPAPHFDKAKRELDIVNEEICGFFPFVSCRSSALQTVNEADSNRSIDVELNLKCAAEKLNKLAGGKPRKKRSKRSKKTCKCKRKGKRKYVTLNSFPNEPGDIEEQIEEEQEEEKEDDDFVTKTFNDDVNDLQISFQIRDKSTPERERESEMSSSSEEDKWSLRPPCISEKLKQTEKEIAKWKQRRKRFRKRRPRKRSPKAKAVDLKEETGVYLKKRLPEKTGSDVSNSNGREEENAVEVFEGDVEALVEDIIKDLSEEGFFCASYPLLAKHPDISQLILYLRGEILTKHRRMLLHGITKARWSQMKGVKKFAIPELGISGGRADSPDWNDKAWISRLAKKKIDRFYYRVANSRAEYGVQMYNTLYQEYFGTERYLKIFYAYMTSKYEDAILRGIS